MAFRIACAGWWALVMMACSCAAENVAFSRPSAVVLPAESSIAFVANAGSGTVSGVDLVTGQIVSEAAIGGRLTDLVECPDRKLMLAVDNQTRCVRLLRCDSQAVTEVQTLQLNDAPLRIAVSADGSMACVTHQWASHVSLLQLNTAADGSTNVSLLGDLSVGFSQQCVAALDDQQFIVADRFRGQLAVVDAAAQAIVSESSLHGHNIRGLTVEPDGVHVLVAHQILSRVARTSFDDVHWGMVMQNVVRRIPTADLLNAAADVAKVGRVYRLGDTGEGFADPTDVLASDGGFAVLSGGTNQLMVMSWGGQVVARVATGVRPTRMIRTDASRFVVLNSLSDSVSVIWQGSDRRFYRLHTGANAPQPQSDVRSGEAAFYSAKLSHDGWMSCHSCHTDGHSPDLLADTLGDGAYGSPKRIPSLWGVADTGPWGWNGSMTALKNQLQQTLTSTMHGDDHSPETINSLVAYLHTLYPPASSHSADIWATRGKALFVSLDCIRCHKPGTWTSPQIYNVGLQDENGQSEFNPPSLRGVGFRNRYFHDGRATSIESVFREFRHNLKTALNEAQLRELTEFLNTL
ncbi:MAG: cytochrome c peroxidase [Fuerstiella sp.]